MNASFELCSRLKCLLKSAKFQKILPVRKLSAATSTHALTYGQASSLTHHHLIKPCEVTPNLTKAEYANRRSSLMQKLAQASNECGNDVVIIPSAQQQFMIDKIPYFFRQNTDFLYFTGCLENDSVLVMYRFEDAKGSSSGDYDGVLFVKENSDHESLWEGSRTGPGRVKEMFDVDRGLPLQDLGGFLDRLCGSKPCRLWYNYANPANSKVHGIVMDSMKNGKKNLENLVFLAHSLRAVKSPAEVELMRRSCDITANAIRNAMKFSVRNLPDGVSEHELFATVDYHCRMGGANFLAYPPVVAGGSNANVIHYTRNNQMIRNGDFVLMDVGGEYGGYASDITRTWPIAREFGDDQLVLYQIVYEVQRQLISQVAPGITIDDLYDKMCQLLGSKLQEARLMRGGIEKSGMKKAVHEFCPHHVSHHLGMDVHDVASVSRRKPLEPGNVVTVEPGLYIRDTNAGVPSQFRGIGIRIEDNILITGGGCEVLSKSIPSHHEDIREILNS